MFIRHASLTQISVAFVLSAPKFVLLEINWTEWMSFAARWKERILQRKLIGANEKFYCLSCFDMISFYAKTKDTKRLFNAACIAFVISLHLFQIKRIHFHLLWTKQNNTSRSVKLNVFSKFSFELRSYHTQQYKLY